MNTVTKLMVVVGGDVGQAVAALKAVDQQAAATAQSMDQHAKQASSAFGGLDDVATMLTGGLSGLGRSLGVAGLATLAAGAARTAVELGNLGQQLQRQRAYFEVWSGGMATATRNLMALRQAVGGAVSESELLAAANRFLSMGLATNAEELARLSRMAVMLGGDTRTAGQAMEEFALLLANRSILRLDTFGISGARVRERITELQAATAGLSEETAFMTAVMEEGERKLKALEAAGISATTATNNLTTARTRLREAAAQRLEAPVANWQQGLAETLNAWTALIQLGSADDRQRLQGLQSELERLKQLKAEAAAAGGVLVQGDQIVAAERDVDKAIQRTQNEISYLTAKFAEWGDVGANAALKIRGAIQTVQPAVVDFAQAWKNVQRGMQEFEFQKELGYWLEAEAPLVGMQNKLLEQEYRRRKELEEKATREREQQADRAARAWESAMRTAASHVRGYVSEAISFSKGLFDVGPKGRWNAPGANGPFENVYRALDVAKFGAASPWASVLGLDQAEATRLTGLFQKGILTPEVLSKLVNMDLLTQQMREAQIAENLLNAVSEQVAAAAGADAKMAKALLTFGDATQLDRVTGGAAKAIATSWETQTTSFTALGQDFILAVAAGAEAAKDTAVSKVEEVARAMIAAMQAVLNGAGVGTTATAAAIVATSGGSAVAARGGVGVQAVGRGQPDVTWLMGDTYNVAVYDTGAAAALAAAMASNRQQRHNRFMGQ